MSSLLILPIIALGGIALAHVFGNNESQSE